MRKMSGTHWVLRADEAKLLINYIAHRGWLQTAHLVADYPEDPPYAIIRPTQELIMILRRSAIVLFLVLGIVISVVALPPQFSKDDVNTPAVRVSTRLVLVDAVVTDKAGQRITDLKKDDFTVLENGKPQKLSAFWFEVPEPPSRTPA